MAILGRLPFENKEAWHRLLRLPGVELAPELTRGESQQGGLSTRPTCRIQTPPEDLNNVLLITEHFVRIASTVFLTDLFAVGDERWRFARGTTILMQTKAIVLLLGQASEVVGQRSIWCRGFTTLPIATATAGPPRHCRSSEEPASLSHSTVHGYLQVLSSCFNASCLGENFEVDCTNVEVYLSRPSEWPVDFHAVVRFIAFQPSLWW